MNVTQLRKSYLKKKEKKIRIRQFHPKTTKKGEKRNGKDTTNFFHQTRRLINLHHKEPSRNSLTGRSKPSQGNREALKFYVSISIRRL